MRMMPPCCFASRSLLFPTLIPVGDESAMNLEAVRAFFAVLTVFRNILRVGTPFAEYVASPKAKTIGPGLREHLRTPLPRTSVNRVASVSAFGAMCQEQCNSPAWPP
jgi:hypothetical protein